MPGVKFAHINIIANDWRKLAEFYQKVFGCKPVSAERKLSGNWIEEATAVINAKINGIHLCLPGYEKNLPTLEIFEYNHTESEQSKKINKPGFAHIAFSVNDVEQILKYVLNEGGKQVGKIVSKEISNAGKITFAYCTDPEGNILELQKWH